MPLFSVVMPSYNHARFIGEAIESVRAQSLPDLELIIVDDASTDDSPRIIRALERRDRRIRSFFHGANIGISRTINEGMDVAAGTFVGTLASDDAWRPTKLERQLAILEENPEAVVWCEGEVVDADGRLTGMSFTQLLRAETRPKSGYIFEELLRGNYIFGSSRCVRRNSLAGIRRREDLKYLNDYQFHIDLARRFPYRFIEEPLALYRLHGGNTVFADLQGYYEDSRKLRRYFLATYAPDLTWRSRYHIWRYGIRIALKLPASRFRALLNRFAPHGTRRRALLRRLRRSLVGGRCC